MTFSKETFSQEVREAVKSAQHEYCKHCIKPIEDYHHRCENSKPNRKLFPLFIQSPFNCVGICRTAHETGIKERYKITTYEAQIYEDWLRAVQNNRAFRTEGVF